MVLRRTSIYQLILTFFGLTSSNASEYRVILFSTIHEIVFHGNGGYDYDTIYNMPIWLRKFTFNKIKEWYYKSKSKENEDSWVKDKEAKKVASQNKKINVPTYVTKASRK